MTTLILALLLSPTADAPALQIEPPPWAFLVPAPDHQPSPPIDAFLARLDTIPVERAIEQAEAVATVGPFDLSVDPFDRGEQVSQADVAQMIAEGNHVAGGEAVQP